MQSNITFGGIDPGVEVPLFRLIGLDIGGVERSPSTQDSPSSDGLLFGSLKNSVREITMTFCLPSDEPVERFQALRRLTSVLYGRTPRQLCAPVLVQDYLMAICTQLPTPTELEWTEELTAVFTAFDPYIYASVDDLDLPLTAGGSVNLYIGCTGSVRPTIKQTIASPLTDPTWTCSNGQSVMLQGGVAAGALVIDCAKGDITLDGVSILTQLSLDSLFFAFDPNPVSSFAPYILTCSNGAAGRVTGRYRWL